MKNTGNRFTDEQMKTHRNGNDVQLHVHPK